MLPDIVAVILVCLGPQCSVPDGSPQWFGDEAACLDYLEEMAGQVTGQDDATVLMVCSDRFELLQGTLQNAK